MKYDFVGRAATVNVRCTDGTVFKPGAFDHNDGRIVPLMWMHNHKDGPQYCAGKALLKTDEEGNLNVYGAFNNTQMGRDSKELVSHGDINSLSVWANNLQRQGCNLYNGDVKEVSLVLSPADPTAHIEQTSVMHSSEEGDEIEAEIYSSSGSISYAPGDIVEHSEEDKENNMGDDELMTPEELGEVFDSLDDTQRAAVTQLVQQALLATPDDVSDEDEDDDEDDEDVQHSDLNDDEYYEDEDDDEDFEEDYEDDDDEDEDDDEDYEYLEEDDVEHSDEGELNDMPHYNVFDTQSAMQQDYVAHAENVQHFFEDSMRDVKSYGSLRDSFVAHAENEDYGITDIDLLFPDAKAITDSPEFIKRETAWVASVMNGTKHIPFARVKSVFANITEDEARAKGYFKGNKKKDEVFTLLKRSTDPQTIYKKNKLNRDDVIDIVSFDVIVFLKGEMRIMLDEEIAGAILVGDGRNASDEDKIQEIHIRPIVSDDDLYAYKIKAAAVTDSDTAKALIRKIILGYSNYKGSGNKTMFVKESVLAQLLLIEDGIGHLMYANEAALATTLRVKNIVEVPDEIFERNKDIDPMAIVVDLSDYVVGADKGGAVQMFDDFDIDFNQMKYLIETRCSGALVKPFSAMVVGTKKESEFGFKSPLKLDKDGKLVKEAAGAGAEG